VIDGGEDVIYDDGLVGVVMVWVSGLVVDFGGVMEVVVIGEVVEVV